MTCYDIPRGNGKTLDDIIIELERCADHLPSIDTGLQGIVDDLKELSKAIEELK